MDRIFLRGLRVDTVIGIYDWERTLIRPLIFDLDLKTDTRAAAASDQMSDSIDYAAVRETVREVALGLEPQLLETLAERLARTLFERFPLVMAARIAIDKPGAIPDVEGVGVEIERARQDFESGS